MSIDVSKFRALNSKDCNFFIHKLEDCMKWLADHGQLALTMEYLKGQSHYVVVNVIADKGYHRDEDYITCLENGNIPNVIPYL